jgi:hypothetical protein
MPFANKFRAMMAFPMAGDTLGDFAVESVDVRDVHESIAGHGYAIEMVLCGPGGKQGVQRALKPLFTQKPMTFSGFGNPYQLWFGRPEVVSLGERRYAVSALAYGARVWLAPEFERLLAYLGAKGQLGEAADPCARPGLIEGYLEEYRHDIALLVSRYHSRLRRSDKR